MKHTPVDISGLFYSSTNAIIMKEAKRIIAESNNLEDSNIQNIPDFSVICLFHCLFRKNMKNDAEAKHENVNTHAARKWKTEYITDPKIQ